MTIPIIAKLQKAFVGSEGLMDAADVDNNSTDQTGVLTGASKQQDVNNRLDATGVGAAIFRFSGSYAAQNSNISEWFGGRQQTRLRCTSAGGLNPAVFTLPGATALNAAFDDLVTAGVPEVIRFVIEYTGDTSAFLSVVPRSGVGNPVIQGTTSIPVRSGIAAGVEITRNSGVLSNYVFDSIGAIGGTDGGTLDAIKLIAPSAAVWDASTNGSLPTTGVIKGNAYRVVNAPADNSGRFGEVMQSGDYVVWDADTFTSWSAEPHQWFVLPAHDVRRISALEKDFLTEVQETPESDRNLVIRGANYADTAGEIRMKVYPTQGAYTPADLNTTGQVDEYTDTSDATGYLAIRFTGTQATLASVLPTLYVYSESSDGTFREIINLDTDFQHRGDFASESDYLSIDTINFSANATLRVYIGSVQERFNIPGLDINRENLSEELQQIIGGGNNPGSQTDEQRIAALESQVASLARLIPHVVQLDEWADVVGPERTTQTVDIVRGYSLIADYRGSGTRYESAGVTYDDTGANVVTYTGLGTSLYRTFGFKVTAPADQVLLWLVEGANRIPFIDMTAAGNYRVNSYSMATAEDQHITNQATFNTLTSGSATLSTSHDDVATYTVTAYPANATNTSRSFQVDTDILVNGTDTLAGHLFSLDIPDDNTAQAARQLSASVWLGPLHNRTVDLTISYATRVSGSDLLVDVQLITAPSDVTVRLINVATIRNYTAPGATTRTDDWRTITDSGGDYTFTGENELLVTFHPFVDGNFQNVVSAAVDSAGTVTELNDVNTVLPSDDYASVEIPDTIDFRTFSPEHYLRHSDLSALLANRNVQWCYGLARLHDISELSVTQLVDFTEGVVLIGETNQKRVELFVDDSDLSDIELRLREL